MKGLLNSLEETYNQTVEDKIPGFAYYKTNIIHGSIFVESDNLFSFDIKSAGPTFCKLMLGENHPFVQKLFSIDDKVERSKLISISISYNRIDVPFTLHDLNIFCKYFILTYIHLLFTDVDILEFIKDGVIFIGKRKSEVSDNNIVMQLISNNLVQVREERLDKYIRYNDTTIIWKDGNIDKIKGKFNNPPDFILSIYKNYPNVELDKIHTIYSKRYFDILYYSRMQDDIETYYRFGKDQKKYLGPKGVFVNTTKDIYPISYLVYVLYPYFNLIDGI